MALHKFGSQSILRLYLVGVCFGEFWQSQRESASNCGGGLLARGRLPGLGSSCLAWVRPAVLCKWLPVGCPSWVLVLVDGAGVPSVLLSVLSLLPHLLRLFFVGWVFPFSPCNPFFTFSLLLSCIIYIILYIRIIIYNLFFTFGLFLILSIRNLNYNSQCYILVLLNKNSILVIF